MPSNKNKKRQTKNSNAKKVTNEAVDTEDAASLSSYLGEGIVDETESISSETLLCLEDVCCDPTTENVSSTGPQDTWVSDMSRVSLVVGTGTDATSLHDQIVQLTKNHEVQNCSIEECFELCNNNSYLLIWVVMPLPTSHEILSLTSSIRYASKCNKHTVIIGVTSTSAIVSADLRLHGIDEIIIKPVVHQSIRDKYSKWTSVQLIPQATDDTDSIDFDDKGLSTPSTPVTPMTPLTPATPCTPASICDDTDKSSFSLSIDSGMESPSPVSQMTPLSIQTISALRNLTPLNQPVTTRQPSASDHTTKEKMRRERIKDSCDQLRVLLPYIRGRKTDMASILEMCVEYLKIVNAALPQEVQNQIVEILSKDTVTSSPQGVRNSVKKLKREQQQLASKSNTNTFVSSLIDKERTDLSSQLNVDNYLSGNRQISQDNENKRDLSKSELEFKQRKRFRMHGPPDGFTSLHSSPSSSASVGGIPQAQQMSSFDSVKLSSKQDLQSFDQTGSFIHIPPHTSLYGEVDTSGGRMFANHVFQDPFPSNTSPFYNSPLNKPQQAGGIERDPYGVYLDTHSVYQYYGNVGNYNVGSFSDYVNPNSVLSMSDTRKFKPENMKFDEHDNTTFPRHQTQNSSDDLLAKK